MTRAAVCQKRRIGCIRCVAKIIGIFDRHLVVLDLTILGLTGVGGHRPLGGAAEAGVDGIVGFGIGRDLETQWVGPGADRTAIEYMLTRVIPIAVIVEVHPGAQVAPGVGGDGDATRGANIEGCEDHSILVVVTCTSAEDRTAGVVVVINGAIRLAVPLRIHTGTEVNVAAEQVTRPVVRQRRRIGVRCIAEVHGVLKPYPVVLHLAVISLSGGFVYSGRRAAEAGVSRAGYGTGWDQETQAVVPITEIGAVEDSLTAILPVAVAVEVYPGAQIASAVGGDGDVARGTYIKRCGKGHAIFIIIAAACAIDGVAKRTVVTGGVTIGLAIHLPVNALAQVDGGGQDVACPVVRQRRRIGVRCIAEILGGPEHHFIILDLAIAGLTVVIHGAGGYAPETGVGITWFCARWDREGEMVIPGRERCAREDVLVSIVPIAIPVEVHPGAQSTRHVGRHGDLRRRVADKQDVLEIHAVLIIRAGGAVIETAVVAIIVQGVS